MIIIIFLMSALTISTLCFHLHTLIFPNIKSAILLAIYAIYTIRSCVSCKYWEHHVEVRGGRWEVVFFWWNFTRFYCQMQKGALYTKVFKKRRSVQTHGSVHSVHVVSGAFSRPTPGHSIWHGEILPQIKSHSLIFVLRTSGQKRCISKFQALKSGKAVFFAAKVLHKQDFITLWTEQPNIVWVSYLDLNPKQAARRCCPKKLLHQL